MTDYCHIEKNVVDESARLLPKAWRNISGLVHLDAVELKKLGWLPVVYVNATYDPTTQVRTGPVGVIVGDSVPANADDVTGTYSVRAKTTQELADDADVVDRSDVSDALVDLAILFSELIEWQLANTPMQATDFSVKMRAKYQSLNKRIVRIRGRL